MPDPDYRALCAELLVALKSWSPHGGGPLECWEDREEEAALIARAEVLLDQPEPVAPTDEELLEAFDGEFAEFFDSSDGFGTTAIPRSEWTKVARAVLARWGTPANALPTPEDTPPPPAPERWATTTVQGLNWPVTLGDFTLVGPADNQGAWRWYERQYNGATHRIKVDHQLMPLFPPHLGEP